MNNSNIILSLNIKFNGNHNNGLYLRENLILFLMNINFLEKDIH